jgi:hypothetical protein
MYEIKAYRAIDDPFRLNQEYIEGHIQVLKDYGIESITSNNQAWFNNPHVYCYVAFDEDKELVGGIRIQVADGVNALPVESAVGEMDTRIYDLIRHYAIEGGVGELCGLWNSKKVKGVGISVVLVRAAISTINQLQFQTLAGICAGYSLQMFQNVGFVIDRNLGSNGNFKYPNENYIAHVVGILNGTTLSTASPPDREKMLSLRGVTAQTCEETGSKGKFTVNYNLEIRRVTPVILPESYLQQNE